MTIRVAFVGAGQMARNHWHALSRVGVPAVVVGVHDRARGQAEEFASLASAPVFSSLQDLLDEARPDVVHVCTPPAAHFDAAHAAIGAGAHVYVEKPFALTSNDARVLLQLAQSRKRLVCAGHQLLHDPAFESLVRRSPGLGTILQADSQFNFRSAGPVSRTSARALANQIIDVLPHPLYTLIAALERFAPREAAIDLAWVQASPTDLQAILQAGGIVGRLSVSLRARPIASSLTLTGTRGSLACDFVRTILVGAGNEGTEPLEKVFNPMLEGLQMFSRTAWSVGRRLRSSISYPGLSELIGAFYRAIAGGGASPVDPQHLLRVTGILEQLVASIDEAVPQSTVARQRKPPVPGAPLAVVTGARGFLGTEIVRSLKHVRGVGRSAERDAPVEREWVTSDLSAEVAADVVAGAHVVIHAAAETVGSYDAHQRNTIEATRNLLRAMSAAGVSRLVLVSSLSVLRPPRTSRELQDESTPRPADPRALGAYVWGKCLQEELIEREAPALGIATRVIRPTALLDPREPALPGLMGRRLFGRWHLALGRPGLPIAVCDVGRCAEAIAWCATHFDEAPAVVNLFDPAVRTRGELAALLRARGWTGRVVWLPIVVIAPAVVALRVVFSLARRSVPERLTTWTTYLRPRSYDPRLSTTLLAAARPDAEARHRTGAATNVIATGVAAANARA